MSYGTNLPDQFRAPATTLDKILRGAKPGDIPVEQPNKFEVAEIVGARRYKKKAEKEPA